MSLVPKKIWQTRKLCSSSYYMQSYKYWFWTLVNTVNSRSASWIICALNFRLLWSSNLCIPHRWGHCSDIPRLYLHTPHTAHPGPSLELHGPSWVFLALEDRQCNLLLGFGPPCLAHGWTPSIDGCRGMAGCTLERLALHTLKTAHWRGWTAAGHREDFVDLVPDKSSSVDPQEHLQQGLKNILMNETTFSHDSQIT